jgi:two-component system, OmpR family, response regulator
MKTAANLSFPGWADTSTILSSVLEVPGNKEPPVFLVDDDPFFLKGLEASLRASFPDVTFKSFNTGEACLRSMDEKPSMVVLDYFLDEQEPYAWTGIDILRHIRKLNPSTKVVVVSGQDSLDVAIDCMDKGAENYISKKRSPFKEVRNVLGEHLKEEEANGLLYKVLSIIGLVMAVVIFIMLFS